VTFRYVTLEASIKIPDLSGGLWYVDDDDDEEQEQGTEGGHRPPWVACISLF
jgi:hypothetical protein